MTSSDTDLHLFLGRVEGKLDAVIASQAGLSQRITANEATSTAHGERLAVLETQKSTAKHLAALVISVIAMIATVAEHLKGWLH